MEWEIKNNRTKPESDEEVEQKVSRRKFLAIIGGGAAGLTAIGSMLLSGKFLSPNVLMEPPIQFDAGAVENYSPDTVTFNKEQKVFIVRTKDGRFYALSAICTHLGCISNWKAEEKIIACPCHGSKFDIGGKVLEGPAPRSLLRFGILLDENNHLIVNKNMILDDNVTFKVKN